MVFTDQELSPRSCNILLGCGELGLKNGQESLLSPRANKKMVKGPLDLARGGHLIVTQYGKYGKDW